DQPPEWTHPPAATHRLRVTTFNAENLFNGTASGFSTSRGARSAREWSQQRQKVAQALLALDSDVLLLQEVEHDRGRAPEVLPEMLTTLNALGERAYKAIAPSVRAGDDAITNAFLYDPARVTPVGDVQRIESKPRPALVQTFERADGSVFHLINVHMKSRGRGCRETCAEDRAAELASVLTWFDTHQTDDPWILGGDFNTLTHEPLWDPLLNNNWARAETNAPTYWFRGQPQQIDHFWLRNFSSAPEAWVQPGYAEMPPMAFTHPLYDVDTPRGASDHNPVILEW
ncbi:MAG: endonuclease/exonuclease/phosphatase family protein, partial [Natronospirillum sp.]